MALTGWLGTELAVKIGVPGPLDPTATYGAAPSGLAVGGLPLITVIANKPTTMYDLSTERSKDFKVVKRSERVKVHSGPENGIYMQAPDGFTGSATVILVRSETDNSKYEAGTEILLYASAVSNQRVYVEFYRWLATVGGQNRFHLQAGTVLVDSNGAVQADELYQMEQFTYNGTGDFINGIINI